MYDDADFIIIIVIYLSTVGRMYVCAAVIQQSI